MAFVVRGFMPALAGPTSPNRPSPIRYSFRRGPE